MKKRVLSIILSAAMVVSTAACGSQSGDTAGTQGSGSGDAQASSSGTETVSETSTDTSQTAAAEEEPVTCTLKVWSPSEDQDPEYGEWLVAMCEQFSELHPSWDITFEYGVCTETDARKLVVQDLDAAADVFIYSSTGLEYFCEENALAEFGGRYLDAIHAEYPSVMVNCLTYEDGGVYGVPMTTNTYFMYYDKSVFSEEDITSLDKMLEKGRVAILVTNGFYLAAFYLGAGCTFFGPGGLDRNEGIVLNTEDSLAMTDYLVDLVKEENFVSASPEDAISMMREGTVDAYFCGTWQAAQTQEILGENFGVAPLPSVTVDGKEVQLRPFNSAKAIGVKSTTAYPQVAVELAMYLGGYDSQLYHYEKRGYVPCFNELVATDQIQQDEVVVVDAHTIDKIAVARTNFKQMSYFWSPAESFGTELRDGKITHENAAEKLAEFEEGANSSGVE